MVDGLDVDDLQNLPPLRLRARNAMQFGYGIAVLIYVAASTLLRLWHGTAPQGFYLAYLSFMALLGVILMESGLIPVVLVADEVGIHWRQFWVRRTYRWAEISSIGVGRSKIMEPADHPVGRFFVQGRRMGAPPSLGINLRVTEADPGSAAYNRGFTGFDINIRADFDRSLTSISEEFQQRLEAARAHET